MRITAITPLVVGVDQAVHALKVQALGVPIYEVYGGRVRDHLRCYPIEGCLAPIPTGPGLGTAVDERASAPHPFAPEPQPRAMLDDGSVADW